MLYRVRGKYRGSIWREKYCECCGSMVDESEYEKDYVIDKVVDAAFPEWAIQTAQDEMGIDDTEDGEWIEPIKALMLPPDEVMWRIGAPTLFDCQQL